MIVDTRPQGSHSARKVSLEPNIDKIIAAIGFLIKEAAAKDLQVTQYDLVKSLFIADRTHLNRYGRPVTFDNYVAMRHGPVPSLCYDLLKSNQVALRRYGLTDLPWVSTQADHLGSGCMLFTGARTTNEAEVLSPSDIETLRNALIIISGLTFGQVRELTHGDQAYKEAWGDGESQNAPMSLGLLFDTPDFEAAEELCFVSKLVSESERISDDDVESYFAQIKAG